MVAASSLTVSRVIARAGYKVFARMDDNEPRVAASQHGHYGFGRFER
jgi:hypothetical protein